MSILWGCTNPRVVFLNIGEEETKSLAPIQHAAPLLRDVPSINHIGYLKANELLPGKIDVLVFDGFIGNVTLKTRGDMSFSVIAKSLWGKRQARLADAIGQAINEPSPDASIQPAESRPTKWHLPDKFARYRYQKFTVRPTSACLPPLLNRQYKRWSGRSRSG